MVFDDRRGNKNDECGFIFKFIYFLFISICNYCGVRACILGVKWKKSSDAKKGISGQPSMPDTVDVKQ